PRRSIPPSSPFIGGVHRARLRLFFLHRKLQSSARTLRTAATSFWRAAEACGTPPQASGARRKLAERRHKLLGRGGSLRTAATSFWGAAEACGPPPQASGARRKLALRGCTPTTTAARCRRRPS